MPTAIIVLGLVVAAGLVAVARRYREACQDVDEPTCVANLDRVIDLTAPSPVLEWPHRPSEVLPGWLPELTSSDR